MSDQTTCHEGNCCSCGHAPSAEPGKIPWKCLLGALAIAALSEFCELARSWFSSQAQILGLLSAALALVAIAVAGLGTFKQGWRNLFSAKLNITTLMSVAVSGAFCIGQYPEAAMVMALFELSEALEESALHKARNAISALLAVAPDMALVLAPDGNWREENVANVEPGQIVRVKPGEKIALDGEIISGNSTVNQAAITGESIPVEKACGDLVFAGTVNESGSFDFRVTAGAKDTTLARIIHVVEEAQGSRAPIQRFVDQFARFYTPAVFALALFAALIPPLIFASPWEKSIYTGLVLLVIGCPCALVISTPVSIVSAMANAARKGMLIKGGAYLELGRKLSWLALDKTGTITEGRPVQTDFIALDSARMPQSLEQIAASLASRSDHPISRAIAENYARKGETCLEVSDFKALPGMGTCGKVAGQVWYLGNLRLMGNLGLISPKLTEIAEGLEAQGKSVVILASSNAQAVLAVADKIKPGSSTVIKELWALNCRCMLLSGDNARTAKAVAHEAGIGDYRAELLPEDKLRIIEQLQADGGIVGMAGDGINDAPALAKANIGFAMARNGTDIAIETADVALMDDDLAKIPRFIRLSRKTQRIVAENIGFALSVKALFFILTFAGMASMWLAVFADVGATMLVVANGLRLLRA